MAKSIRAKIKKRLRTAKRQRVDAMLVTPREREHYDALQKVIEGRSVTLSKTKNAFKYPEEDDAFFPQRELMKPIDFRSKNLPVAGYAFRGNRRKYEGEQAEYMDKLKKKHPKYVALAGGGAVHAKTGRKVSLKEAELMATAVQRPEAHAVAIAGVGNASSAVAAACAEDEDDDDMESASEDVPEPLDAADHSRRPIVKKVNKNKGTSARPSSGAKKSKKGHGNASAASVAEEMSSRRIPAAYNVKKGAKTSRVTK